ncbi:MAG: hypothetical protein IKC56_00030 [Clostridia bacterium]|nr:hypothetical protein [Clostridia bacterium]
MRNLGRRLQAVLLFVVFAAFCLLAYTFVKRYSHENAWDWVFTFLGVILGATAVAVLHPVFHELGHVIFGKIAGLQLVAFRAGIITYQGKLRLAPFTFGGECVMLPKGEKDAGKKRRIFAWGGIVGSAIFCFSLLWSPFAFSLSAPVYAGLTTATLYAVYELISNLFPSEGREKTDGEVLFASYKNTDVSVVETAVFAAQSVFVTGKTPADISRSLLYGIPVISEGEEAFALLTHLRLLRAILCEERAEVEAQLLRAEGLLDVASTPAYRALLPEIVFGYSLLNDTAKAEEYYAELVAEEGWYLPARYRAEAAYCHFIKRDETACERAKTHARQMLETLPLTGEKETEERLLSLVE